MSYNTLVKAAQDYLNREPGVSKSGKEIAEFLLSEMDNGHLDPHPKNVIFAYLSRAANHDDESDIVSGGASGGYSVPVTILPSNAELADIENSDVIKATLLGNGGSAPIREKHLYPLLRLWLHANDYVSEDVSSLKAGGQWGNPDLLGVSHVEILGSSEIELVSVEVKLSDANWERFIFEAVSHKRFVNRSWFCFRTVTPSPALPKAMAYYAERYRVGILQVYLTDSDLDKLATDGEAVAPEFLERVFERIRALHEAIPLSEKRSFLERAGMKLNMNVSRTLK